MQSIPLVAKHFQQPLIPVSSRSPSFRNHSRYSELKNSIVYLEFLSI